MSIALIDSERDQRIAVAAIEHEKLGGGRCAHSFVIGALWSDDNPNWKDITKHKPYAGNKYIVLTDKKEEFMYNYTEYEGWVDDAMNPVCDVITHWMYTPKPI